MVNWWLLILRVSSRFVPVEFSYIANKIIQKKIRFFQQKSQDLEPFTFIITVNFNSTCHTPKSIFFPLKTSGISSDSDCGFYFFSAETCWNRNYLYLINYSSCKFQNFGRNNSKIGISLRMFFSFWFCFCIISRKRIFLRRLFLFCVCVFFEINKWMIKLLVKLNWDEFECEMKIN